MYPSLTERSMPETVHRKLRGATRRRLRILHISDLHERGERESEPWRRRRVLGQSWENNLSELLQDGPIDLVCFTGDVADWGRSGEYELATGFFEDLLKRLALGRERLFVIPGNHDIDRSIHHAAWEGLREAGPKVDDLALSRWLAGGDAPYGVDETWREQVLARQAAFRAWVRDDLGRIELDPTRSPHGNLGYHATLEMRNTPVHVIGLDTAWLCGDDTDTGHLRLTDEQVMNLATDTEGRPLSGLRLVLMHHPLHELADGPQARRLLAEHADLVLRGHLHETEFSTWTDPDSHLPQLTAGCLYEGDRADRWPNSCQLLTLHLDAADRLHQIDVRLRSFSPRGGHWYDDDGLYRDSRQGRLSLYIEQPDVAEVRTNPFDPWTPATAPNFIGRSKIFKRLEAALEEGHSVSLVGDWRIGKSSLLVSWHERVLAAGRIALLLSGEGPEGVSASAFVAKITGRSAPDHADGAADALTTWVAAAPAGLPPVLLVDEFDGMVPRFDLRFFERLRGLLGRIVLVLASRREIDRLYKEVDRTSPFSNRLKLERLGLLEDEAAEAVITLAGQDLGTEDRVLMRHWAGRHPFYLQLLGRHLLDARRFGEDRESALDRFRDEASIRLRELYSRLADRDRQALLSAVRGESIKRPSLVRRGLLDENGRPFGEVFAEWLREEA
jgi:predicted MPP superfamily phosphohydrolase